MLRALWRRMFPPGPTLEESWDELKPRFESFRVTAWRPICSEEDTRHLSQFGGRPLLETADDAPTCARCNRPMPLFLQVSSKELPEAATSRFPKGLLQVFFCLECQPWEAFSPGCLVRTLGYDSLERASSSVPDQIATRKITGWKSVTDYDDPETSDENHGFSDAELEVLYEGHYPSQGDKLLGAPYWVQYPEYPDCPQCHKPTTAIFQLDSNDQLDFMWGDAGVALVVWCPEHPQTLGLTWQCH